MTLNTVLQAASDFTGVSSAAQIKSIFNPATHPLPACTMRAPLILFLAACWALCISGAAAARSLRANGAGCTWAGQQYAHNTWQTCTYCQYAACQW